MLKETAVVAKYLLEGTEKTTKKYQPRYPLSGPRIEARISRI
jgi:hypothetical protein